MQSIVIASNNNGKLQEFSRLLAPLQMTFHAQGALGVTEADEPHFTFIENALAKARHTAAVTGMPALADDSGLCVTALGNAPGVQSARYAGEPKSDAANNRKLISALQGIEDRSAFFYCVLVYLRHAEDPHPIIAEGRWDGVIIDEARGANGFGYDPHFWLPALGKTAAELGPDEKNDVSHRGQALRALITALQ